MRTYFYRLTAILLALLLGACATGPAGAPSQKSIAAAPYAADYFPGGSQFYSYGVSQSKENFANVERAQSDYSLYAGPRHWVNITVGHSPSEFNLLQAYYPLHVRWKLKDGREFILEKIDVRAVMREYFKTHQLQLQHQKEGRAWDSIGDSHPSFVHEVNGDDVVLKWLLTTNKTPVKERLQPNGAANRWSFVYEEHIVTSIKGKPTSGIDFENWVEIKQ